MTRIRLPLALLLLVAFAAQAPAEIKPAPKTLSFLYYYMGSRVGWAKITISEVEYEGRKVVLEHETGWLQIKRSFDGAEFEYSNETDTWQELDGTPIKVIDITRNGKQEVRLETVYAADHITITGKIDKGKQTVTKLDRGEKTIYSDMRAWRVLKDGGRLKAGEKLRFHSVDDDDRTLVEQAWTVSGKVKRKLGDDSTVEGVEIRVVRGGRAMTVLMGDDNQPLLSEDVGGFSLERTDKIPSPFKVEPVTLRSSMKANVAIADWRQITRMDVSFDFEHDDDEFVPPIADSNDYHQVIKAEKGYAFRLKSTKLKRDYKSPKYPLTETPDDVKKYLDPTDMCQSDDPVLLAEAQKLAKGKKEAVDLARAAMRFTDSRLQPGSGDTGAASARQAYDERKGDCTEHAALFVALARAAGLPARNVGGFVYACSEDGSNALFGYHAWAEVWIGHWVPVDPTVGELGCSARYVLFDIDEPGETHGQGRSSRTIRQGIEPMVDSYELASGKTWTRKGAKIHEWD